MMMMMKWTLSIMFTYLLTDDEDEDDDDDDDDDDELSLKRDGERRDGKRGRLYLTLHCHHQNDSCIKTGSYERHCNVSLTVRDKVTSQCPQTTTFVERGESKQNRTEVPLLTSLTPYR